ncbi:TPA: hypothetical protein ACH3X1_015984 [Trebouxia sp. C0004]
MTQPPACRATPPPTSGGRTKHRQMFHTDAVSVQGDAAEYAYAAYTPGGEFAYPMVVSFTKEELALMSSNQFSSTLIEILCIYHLKKVLLEVDPASIQHKRLRYRPVLDAFASSANTKVPEAFYSKFHCPGSKGIDAMIHPWANLGLLA